MIQYNINNIKAWISLSLKSLSDLDKILLERQVKEECINHRLARFLELCYGPVFHDEFPAFMDIDLEYNKNVNQGAKILRLENGESVSIRPDIIFHDRLTNDNNVLAIESKLGYLRNGDRLKLDGLIKNPFNYQFTAGISYLPKNNYFKVLVYTSNEITSFTVQK